MIHNREVVLVAVDFETFWWKATENECRCAANRMSRWL